MRRLLAIAIVTTVSVGVGWPFPGAEEKGLIEVIHLPFNTSADEDDPHVADAGQSLYYTLSAKGKDDLHVARRRGAQPWPAKTMPIDDYIKNKGESRSAFATQGSYPHFLFFSLKDEKAKNFDLYVAVKHGTGKVWSAPTPVTNANTSEDECFPWVTGDGKSLYFSRKTKEGWTLMASGRANATGPQGWREPVTVELPIGFHHATFTPDGKTMIVQGPLEKDRWGLFLSTKAGKGWSKPEPLTGLNHPDSKIGDRSPNLSRDGSLLYFASDRPGGKGGLDIYAVKMASLRKK